MSDITFYTLLTILVVVAFFIASVRTQKAVDRVSELLDNTHTQSLENKYTNETLQTRYEYSIRKIDAIESLLMSQQSTIDYLTSQNDALVKAGAFSPTIYNELNKKKNCVIVTKLFGENGGGGSVIVKTADGKTDVIDGRTTLEYRRYYDSKIISALPDENSIAEVNIVDAS